MRGGDGNSMQLARNNRNSLQYQDSDLDRFLGLSRANGPIEGEEDMVAAVNSIGGPPTSQAAADESEEFRRDAGLALSYGNEAASPMAAIRAA